jgi:hypothetical protein
MLRLHPDNPRYLEFRGRTLAPVTAGEHYGAVINPDFDGVTYLDMLKDNGFRLTRVLCLLREMPGEFGAYLGLRNTLCPPVDRYVAPWLRTNTPGCLDGGAKFDLERWNPVFFERLERFCRVASDRGIVVEVTLFSQLYNDNPAGAWRASPLHPSNNVQGVGVREYWQYLSLLEPRLTAAQVDLSRRVARALRGLDNVYIEICNEPNPMPGQPSVGLEAIGAWHNRIVQALVEEEAALAEKHLIAVNDPTEHVDVTPVSILTFHYRDWAFPGLEKWANAGKMLSFDETLSGVVNWNPLLDFPARRREAWEYMLSGGGGYDYLDFTVATGDPRGEGQVEFPDGQYYDGRTMRDYLRHLNTFLDGLDLAGMKPDKSLVRNPPRTAKVSALTAGDGSCAVYVQGDGVGRLALGLCAGEYAVDWFHPSDGLRTAEGHVVSRGETTTLPVPQYREDIALHARKLEA